MVFEAWPLGFIVAGLALFYTIYRHFVEIGAQRNPNSPQDVPAVDPGGPDGLKQLEEEQAAAAALVRRLNRLAAVAVAALLVVVASLQAMFTPAPSSDDAVAEAAVAPVTAPLHVQTPACIGPFLPGQIEHPGLEPAIRELAARLSTDRASGRIEWLYYVGSADLQPLRSGLKARVPSNDALALARAKWVQSRLHEFAGDLDVGELVMARGPRIEYESLEEMTADRYVAVFAAGPSGSGPGPGAIGCGGPQSLELSGGFVRAGVLETTAPPAPARDGQAANLLLDVLKARGFHTSLVLAVAIVLLFGLLIDEPIQTLMLVKIGLLQAESATRLARLKRERAIVKARMDELNQASGSDSDKKKFSGLQQNIDLLTPKDGILTTIETRLALPSAGTVGKWERAIYVISVAWTKSELIAGWLVLKALATSGKRMQSDHIYIYGNALSIVSGLLLGLAVLSLSRTIDAAFIFFGFQTS